MNKIIDILKRVIFVIWVIIQGFLIYDCFKQIYQYLNENTVEGFERFVIIGEAIIMTFVTIVFIVATVCLVYREIKVFYEEKRKQTNEDETS